MTERRQITEYLALDLEREAWCCHRCGCELGSARENYKKFCLVHERDPREIHPPSVSGPYTLAPDPEWCRIVEFYCPDCATQFEVEYLPPGHPITWDIAIDLDAMKSRSATSGER